MSGIGVRRHSPAKREGQQTVLNSRPNSMNCAVPDGEGTDSLCAHNLNRADTAYVNSCRQSLHEASPLRVGITRQ